jgi:hypothetical protein
VKEEATEAKEGDKGEANKVDEKEHKGKQREPTSDMWSTHGSLNKGEEMETECHDSASGYENNTGGSNESSTLPL